MKLKSEEEFRQHTCSLSLPSYPSYFSSIGVFDIETAQYGSKGFHDAMLVCYSYERAFGGIFQDIAFGATAFGHPLLNSIFKKPYIQFSKMNTDQLLHKPYVNEVTLRGQNPSSKCY